MIGLAALQVCPSGLPAHYPAPPAQPESAEQIAASSFLSVSSYSIFEFAKQRYGETFIQPKLFNESADS